MVLALLSACGRFGFHDLPPPPDVDAATTPDAPDPTLHVSVTADRMAGPPTLTSIGDLPSGTAGLSLREALTIAANHPGPDLVVFDPAVFPVATPVTLALGAELVIAGDATTLDATGAGVVLAPGAGFAGALVRVTGADDIVDGLTLQQGDLGIAATGVTGLIVRHVHAIDTVGEAVRLESVANVTVEDTRIDHAGPAPIRVVSSIDTTIQRTFVALAAKTGVVYGVRIESSLRIHVLANTLDPGTAWMVSLDNSSDNEVVGNIIDGGDTGIALTGTSDRNYLFRNVVIAPAADSIYLDSTTHDNTALNNTFYLAPDITDDGMNTTAANNLLSASSADFVAPDSYDFHLGAGSTAIDAATDVGQDMLPDAPTRYLGAGPDLGAVESY